MVVQRLDEPARYGQRRGAHRRITGAAKSAAIGNHSLAGVVDRRRRLLSEVLVKLWSRRSTSVSFGVLA